jgi:glutaredoxin
MDQRCHLSMIWLTWVGLPLLAVVAGIRGGVVAGAFVLIVGVAAQILYVRQFPRISGWLGYGSVADTPADAAALPRRTAHVRLYTANVCPFCPIVKRRLEELRRQAPFELEEIDVTFRPQIIREKGLRSVPVVEAGGQRVVGNATSAQLAALLATAASQEGG